MSLVDQIGHFIPRRRVRLGERRSYQLTMLGKDKVEKMEGSGANWEILSYLDENAPCNIREISAGTHQDEGKVKLVLKRLMDSGYVAGVKQEG